MARTPTDTKLRILIAARMLFSTHGCQGTTLDDIITASGITKGAFYHYFKSKDALCEAVLETVTDDYRQLTESIDSTLEPIQQLRQMTEKLAQLNSSGEWVNCRLMLRLSADSHESHQKIHQKIHQFWQWYTGFFETLIQNCQDAGQLSDQPNAKTQAELLISVMAGAVTLEKITTKQVDSAKLTEIVIGALGGKADV